MEIECLRCHEKHDISKEKLDKIREIQLEEMNPQDLLDYFPLIAGRCKKEGFQDKKHAFKFTDEYIDEVKKQIEDIIKANEVFNKAKETIEKSKNKIDELKNQIEKLEKTISENENIESEYKIKTEDVLNQFEQITGTRNIDSWK